MEKNCSKGFETGCNPVLFVWSGFLDELLQKIQQNSRENVHLVILGHFLQNGFPQNSSFPTKIQDQVLTMKLKHSLWISNDRYLIYWKIFE